jgi:hypothetical protein
VILLKFENFGPLHTKDQLIKTNPQNDERKNQIEREMRDERTLSDIRVLHENPLQVRILLQVEVL